MAKFHLDKNDRGSYDVLNERENWFGDLVRVGRRWKFKASTMSSLSSTELKQIANMLIDINKNGVKE